MSVRKMQTCHSKFLRRWASRDKEFLMNFSELGLTHFSGSDILPLHKSEIGKRAWNALFEPEGWAMKMLRVIGFVGFLSLTGLDLEPNVRGGAMQPPRFTLTDLGSVDGQANPYTPPTGYLMKDLYNNPDSSKNNWRTGWSFARVGDTKNLLPDFLANDVANGIYYELRGYSSNGVVFGDDYNTGSSFYFNTNTNEYGNFNGSGLTWTRGITSLNSSGQALGATGATLIDENGANLGWNTPTYYSSLMSDPILLKDLISTSLNSWLLYDGASINDNGQIFGKMFNFSTKQMDYYRLDPVTVPEPSTVMVLTIGSLLFIARHRIRR